MFHRPLAHGCPHRQSRWNCRPQNCWNRQSSHRDARQDLALVFWEAGAEVAAARGGDTSRSPARARKRWGETSQED